MHNNSSSKHAYAELVREIAADAHNEKFRDRAERIAENAPQFFTDDRHSVRFTNAALKFRESENENKFIAALYLITADFGVWNRLKYHIADGKIKFINAEFNGIGINGRNLFRAASDILCGTKYLVSYELASYEMVSDSVFETIVNGLVIAKFGIDTLICE